MLKDIYFKPELKETLDVWDMQLNNFGSSIIERRKIFIKQINEIIKDIHGKLTGNVEILEIIYDPCVESTELESKVKESRNRDINMKCTNVGPHKDDLIFLVNGKDVRKSYYDGNYLMIKIQQ